MWQNCCKLLTINIHEYLINVVRKQLALISALPLVINGTNKGLRRLQWGEKVSVDWLRAGIFCAVLAAEDIVSSIPDSYTGLRFL